MTRAKIRDRIQAMGTRGSRTLSWELIPHLCSHYTTAPCLSCPSNLICPVSQLKTKNGLQSANERQQESNPPMTKNTLCTLPLYHSATSEKKWTSKQVNKKSAKHRSTQQDSSLLVGGATDYSSQHRLHPYFKLQCSTCTRRSRTSQPVVTSHPWPFSKYNILLR